MTMRTQKLAVVSGNGLSIVDVKDRVCEPYLNDTSQVHEAVFDKSGRYICWCSSNGTYLMNLVSNTKIVLSETNKYRKISFSPKGNYVSLFSVNYGTSTEDNVYCFNSADGTKVNSFRYSNSGPWVPQWSADESLCIRVHKSEVLFYSPENMAAFHGRIALKGLESASIQTCGSKNNVAVYVSGAKGMPHMVKIYQYPNLADAINNRSFFKANDVYIHWSPSGKVLLFLVHTETSKTNYYGENSLYFMSAEVGGETAVVEMPKGETNVHDVHWQPLTGGSGGDRFIVTYGNPVAAAVFNVKCQMLYVIDSPNRNVCQFSHCGAALAMMGAGGVRSSIQLWNFGGKKMFGEFDVEDVNRICWSGDDSYLVSATVSPALRVNNGLIIWDVDGEMVADRDACSHMIGQPSEIYSVSWKPDPESLVTHNQCSHHKGVYFFDSKCRKFKEKPTVSVNSTYVPPHLRKGLKEGEAANGGVKKEAAVVGPGMRFTGDIPPPSSQPAKSKKKKNKNKSATATAANSNSKETS